MKKLGVFIVCLIISHALSAQEYISLSGRVLDTSTKEPIPFASIYIKEKAIGTTTNQDGAFAFHIPSELNASSVSISMLGYESIEKRIVTFTVNDTIYLRQNIEQLDDVVLTSGKPLTAKQIVKKAYKAIKLNYPTKPYILEGFIRDLQNEDGKYVELLECAARFYYKDYKDHSSPQVELQEVRRSYIANKNPWNKAYERKNSIIDLIEDDFIRYDYGPIKVKKGWSYTIESIQPFMNTLVYKITAENPPFQKATLYIDTNSFAFIRIELTRYRNKKGKYYKRRLSNGQQEANYNIIFEYQELKGKMYLKYLKEEDTWHIFKDVTSKQPLFEKNPKKELFISKVLLQDLHQYTFNSNLSITKSIENQAKEYNPEFWKYYNAPILTTQESKIIEELKKAHITPSIKE